MGLLDNALRRLTRMMVAQSKVSMAMYHYVSMSFNMSFVYTASTILFKKIEPGPEKTSVGTEKKSFPKGHDLEQNVKNDNRLQ